METLVQETLVCLIGLLFRLGCMGVNHRGKRWTWGVEESVMDGGESRAVPLSPERGEDKTEKRQRVWCVFSTIKFSERVHAQIDKSMRNVIIVRLLGRSIGFGTLQNRLHSMWELAGEIQLVDLEYNYYLVRFSDPQDYTMALTKGPWTIYGSYLTVQPWSRDFTPTEKHPSQVVVWIRLPGLPYRYYCKALFRRIATVIGRVVKVDYNTKVAERGKFARLAVMVDLNKPLKSCIGIDNFVQRLEYEGLQNICYGCGVYGHSQEECTVGRVVPNTEREISRVVGPRLEADGSLSERYGPWMVAANRVDALVSEEDGAGSEQNVEEDRNVGATESLSGPRVEGDVIARGKRVIQGNGVKHNKAYMVSNPSRGPKGDKRVSIDPKEVAVVSLVEDAIAEGFVREVSAKKGNHLAATILDGTQGLKGSERVGEGSLKHNGRQNRGVRLKQPLGVCSSPRASVSNWVPVVLDDQPGTLMGKGYDDDGGRDCAKGRTLLPHFFDTLRILCVRINRMWCFCWKLGLVGPLPIRLYVSLVSPILLELRLGVFSGGIWMLWRDDVLVDVTHVSTQFLNCRCRMKDETEWVQVTAVYASPVARLRRLVWNPLLALDPGEDVPWLLGEILMR
ncbi:hypothetical protein GQ457_08G008970 [Hibiscus cannabinus]